MRCIDGLPVVKVAPGGNEVERLMLLASADAAAADQAFPNFRLSKLVAARFDMDVVEANRFLSLCGAVAMPPPHTPI
jgi:hypothetical protein